MLSKSVLLLLFSLTLLASSQSCVSNIGTTVDWWLVLKYPKQNNRTGFIYTDSSIPNSTFSSYDFWPDVEGTALNRTLKQINDLSLNNFAWNDDAPGNGTDSSTLAHSKGVIAFDTATAKGFQLVHSVPSYPAYYNNNQTVNATINSSQLIYGQHLFCMSLGLSSLEFISEKLRITRLNIYASNVAPSVYETYPNLFNLSQKIHKTSTNKFELTGLWMGAAESSRVRAIFKNGKLNCSIFEDGLSYYFQSQVLAETWGRPLLPSYCNDTYPVRNVLSVDTGMGVSWLETNDHSKWAITTNGYYSCFGDMNRMSSQWKRGGAFYCLQSQSLTASMGKLIKDQQPCGIV